MTTTTDKLSELAKGVRIAVGYDVRTPFEEQDDWQQKANGYRCTLHYKGRRYSFDFWQGRGIQGQPTVEGTLECLLSDAQSADNGTTFEDFCLEMGYDADIRKAEKIYKACKRVAESLKRLLRDDYERFLYADRD